MPLLEGAHEVTSFRDAGQRQNFAERKRRGSHQLLGLTEAELAQKPGGTYTHLSLKKMSEMRDRQTYGSSELGKSNPASITIRNEIHGRLNSGVTMPVLKACH